MDLQVVRNYEFSVGFDPEAYTYELVQGRGRYNKVIAKDVGNNAIGVRAVAFQDKQTGSVFRAASWSAPAKTRIA